MTDKNSDKSNNNSFNNKSNKILNFICNSSNKIIHKDELTKEKGNNIENINLNSSNKEKYFKLNSYSQGGKKVIFSSGIEEIDDDGKIDSSEEKYFFNISKRKFSTPPRNTKLSYKKTKEHIKTPYRTTKSRSSRNKSKQTKDIKKNNISTKSTNYWRSLLFDDERLINDLSPEQEIDINRNCNSIILENPYVNKSDYRFLFCNNSLEDNDEELNKSF
jgi:hypothetical protein